MKKSINIFGKPFIVAFAAMILLLGVSSPLLAQTAYSVAPGSSITINGTSSLHDWESEVTKMIGTAQIDLQGQQIESIDKLFINIPVTSIKSGKSAMDKNTYEALKKDDHPEIKFELKQIKSAGGGQLKAQGNLTIAGVTKSIEMPVKYSVNSEKVEFKGSVSFNMSEFKVDPPTALMGTVKTGDKVILNFDTVFVRR